MKVETTLKDALRWITGILAERSIPYQVVGGLAARCYGADRPLHDIDMYVPGNSLKELAVELDGFLEFGPEYHEDEYWKIVFMKLKYKCWQIEIADAGQTYYFDAAANRWIQEEIDFNNSVELKYKGLDLRVMPKERLVAYKQSLDRKVDRVDVGFLKKGDL